MRGDQRTIAHVDFNPADIDMIYHPHVEVIGNIGDSARRIAQKLKGASFDNGYFLEKRPELWAHILEGADDPRFPMLPSGWSRRCARRCPTRGCFASTTASTRSGSRAITGPTSRIRCCSTMPSPAWARACLRIMAALLYSGRHVIAVCGDGGFMMSSQELETAIRQGVNPVLTWKIMATV